MTTKPKRTRTATTHKSAFVPTKLPLTFLILCLVVNPILSTQASAPERPKDYALIVGTVWGPEERPAPGVKVKIRRANETKARWEVISNDRGEFLQRVPVGKQDYAIWTDLKGHKDLKTGNLHPGNEVTVHIESNERADTGLHLK